MKRFFGRKDGERIIFDEGEAKHIRQVLRMKTGDKVIASLNDENDYFCTLTEIGKNSVVAQIDEVRLCAATPKKEIVLFQAMPKREYFETIVTKSIELGVNRVVPFISKFTVNHAFKRDRVEQIVLTACKQCERSLLPTVEDVISFKSLLSRLRDFDIVIFANEHEEKPFDLELKSPKKIALIVGAEAGFGDDEIEQIKSAGATSVSLGTRILRCDTASVALMSIVDILSGN